MPAVIVVGAQWGDEGKGKVIDILTAKARHVVRSQGGNNAGHTIIIGHDEYKLHLTPSGILQPHTQCYIAAGCVIDPEVLVFELQTLQSKGVDLTNRLWISPAAHIIFPYHRKLDLLLEQKKGPRAVGTTGRGIGPCYADKANRIGIRMGELMQPELFTTLLKNALVLKNDEMVKLHEEEPLSYEEILTDYTRYAQFLAPFVTNVEEIIDHSILKGESVLFEGAQGTFLDSSVGTYPFVTASSTIAGGICTGAGIGPSRISHTLGVLKAYTTRVGLGPLPSEISEKDQFLDHQNAREYGTTTRRKRRIGWFDAVLAKTSARLNGLDSIAVTKLDVFDTVDSIKICVAYEINGKRTESVPYLSEQFAEAKPIYETMKGWKMCTSKMTKYKELPKEALDYLQKLESLTGVPISMISLGPERNQTIMLHDPFSARQALI